ncbi:MAG: GAF domain-containing protein, partial [Acidobacteriota bacterium]
RTEKNAADRARSEQVLAGLLAAVQTASRTTDLRELAEETLGRALDLAGAVAGTVHLVDPGTRSLKLKTQRGMSQQVLDDLGGRVGRTIIGRAFETGQPHLHPAGTDEHLDAATGLRFQAAFPLRALSGVHGILAVARTDDRLLGEAETRALTALSELLGLSVENARAFAKAPAPGAPQADLLPQLVQAQKMESIGTLAGGIAHEFNNILTSILGYASHIESLTTSDNPIQREAVTIARQARRAAELTQQLVAFARGGQYSLEPVDLNRSIAETVSLLSKSIDPRIVVEVRPDPDLPYVEADAGQIQQVVMNVAVNAAEAMPEGGRITFETRVAHLDQAYVRSQPGLAPGDYVEVVVGDTGAGMQPDV